MFLQQDLNFYTLLLFSQVFPEDDWNKLTSAFRIILIQMPMYMLIVSFLQICDLFMGKTVEMLKLMWRKEVLD